MTADNHVNTVDRCRNLHVAAHAHMGHHHDFIDPGHCQSLDQLGQNVLGMMKRHVRAGARQLIRILGKQADDADHLAANLLCHEGRDFSLQQRLIGKIGIGEQHGEVDHVDEGRKGLRTIIELVIADRHGIETDHVHQLRAELSFVGRVVESSLELISGAKRQDIFAICRQGFAALIDPGL